MAEPSGMTKRIRKRKPEPPTCRKCGVKTGPRDDGWHLDAGAESLCKWCYTAKVRSEHKKRGEICFTCKFSRPCKSFGGKADCPYRKGRVSIAQAGCRRWRLKKPMEDQ